MVDRPGQRGAKSGKMRAAVALRDVVGEAEHILMIAVIPFQRSFYRDPLLFRCQIDGFGQERVF